MIVDGSVRDTLRQRLPRALFTPESLNERNPDLVKEVHGEFSRAGAQIHRTNTQQANSIAMAPLGLEERCEAMNNSASFLLREVIGGGGIRMGAIGMIEPRPGADSIPQAERERAYSEQVIYLSDTEIEFFVLEHFRRVEEVSMLIRLIKRNSDAPVLAQVQFDSRGATEDGIQAAEAATQLAAEGADALGVSCSPAPQHLPAIVDALLASSLPVSVLLGIAQEGAEPPYRDPWSPTPEAFAQCLAEFARRGVALVGGCCGVGPGHIAALAGALKPGTGD